MKARLLVAMPALLLAGPVAGCGRSDTHELSKTEYVSRLNAMCLDFNARERVIGEPNSLGDLVDKEPRILDAFEDAIADKVGSLRAPPEVAGQAKRLVEIAEEQRDVLSGLVDAAQTGEVATVQELVARNAALNEESSAIARRLGAKDCS